MVSNKWFYLALLAGIIAVVIALGAIYGLQAMTLATTGPANLSLVKIDLNMLSEKSPTSFPQPFR